MYEPIPPDSPLSQGDIIDDCPLILLDEPSQQPLVAGTVEVGLKINIEPTRVVVLTQACDLAQEKSTKVLVAAIYRAQDEVDKGVLKAKKVIDNIRRHQVFGSYFLPAAEHPVSFPESIVDLRELHTIHKNILQQLIAEGKGVCRLLTPYREHLAQHFGVTYMRIGLPEPYETQP